MQDDLQKRQQIIFNTMNEEQKDFTKNVMNGTIASVASSLQQFLSEDMGLIVLFYKRSDIKIVKKIHEFQQELMELTSNQTTDSTIDVDRLLEDVDLN